MSSNKPVYIFLFITLDLTQNIPTLENAAVDSNSLAKRGQRRLDMILLNESQRTLGPLLYLNEKAFNFQSGFEYILSLQPD